MTPSSPRLGNRIPETLVGNAERIRVVLRRCDSADHRPSAPEREQFRRRVIGEALGVDGASLAFAKDKQQRPFLTSEELGSLQFSCASTRGVLAIAVARSACIGIDVERREIGIMDDALCAAALNEEERRSVERSRCAATAFFDLWCRKEAVLKAAGLGLRCDPRCIDVSGTYGEDGWIRTSTPDRRRWWVRSLSGYDGCSVALAADQREEVEVIAEVAGG